MAEGSTGGAPASSGGDVALPSGVLSMPKTVDKPTGNKQSRWDLEADVVDEPVKQIEEPKEEKPKPKTEPKKVKEPVVQEVDDEEDEDEDADEADEPVKRRKPNALDLTNDDEDEDGEAIEASDDEDEPAKSPAEDTSKIDPKELDKKYKINVKDGDKDVEKEFSLKQLIAMAQKNETGDLKLYQASEINKKVENVIQRLQNEPFEVLKYIASQTNKDYYQLIEAEYADQFKLNMMTPEQKQTHLQAEQDKRDLINFRTAQENLQKKIQAEELTKQQTKIANDFVGSVGDVIQADPYLKHVYDNLDEGDDKNYIIRKFGSLIQNGLLMKQKPVGDPHYLPPNFDLSPKNPVLVDLIVKEIKSEAEQQLKQAQKAQRMIQDSVSPEQIVNSAGTKVREKVPGVKSKPNGTKKVTSKEKKAKKQSTHEFLRELLY